MKPWEEISHVENYPQHHSGLVFGRVTGALVLVDLFAVQLMSWGQTVSWQLSPLWLFKQFTWVLKRVNDLTVPRKPACFRELPQPVPQLRVSPHEFNLLVSDPFSGSRCPEGDFFSKVGSVHCQLEALPGGGGSQGSLWARWVSRILFKTKVVTTFIE